MCECGRELATRASGAWCDCLRAARLGGGAASGASVGLVRALPSGGSAGPCASMGSVVALVPREPHADVRRGLEAFLVDPAAAPLPPLPLLERARLAGYAYTMLDRTHPARAQLLPAFLTATTAHELALATLAPLVAAWRAEGVEVVAFKGLALALATYAVPGQRFYDDVDMLMRPADGARAERVALDLGWSLRRSAARRGRTFGHSLMLLDSPDRRLELDVHQLMLHSYAPWQGLQRRLTEAAWGGSRETAFAGTRVRVLDPRDAILMGLVLNRCWSTDGWRLKPRDYVDFETLVERHEVTEPELRDRARELRCGRTLSLFLERCDPYRRRLDLRTPGWRRSWWSLQVAHERRPYRVDRALTLPLVGAGVLVDVVREMPGLVRVLALLRRERDVRRLLARLAPDHDVAEAPSEAPARASGGPLDEVARARRRFRVVRGVRWALWLLRVRREGDCLPRSLAVFARLRRLGEPAVFVSGVRPSGDRLAGHAWVELDGEVLPELEDSQSRLYVANVRYPDDRGTSGA